MQRQIVSPPVSLFCAAAPADASFLEQWETHILPLQQTNQLSFWSERSLKAGEPHLEQLRAWLAQADIVIFLVSAEFFANEECLILMNHALQRLQGGEKIQVVPLLVRPALWHASPLRLLTCLPTNGIPVTTWGNLDEGWHSCVLGIQQLLGLSPLRAQRSPTDKRDYSDRGRLLRWLQHDYQRNLDESLQHLAWLELGLAEQPDAVRNATHLLQRHPDRSVRALPAGTSILEAYDQAGETLLILGDPGAGKSTLLSDLALHLITRAQQDDTHPLPVILPLSSWAVTKPELSDWMVKQLARIYDVPRTLGQQWVQQGQILPLLDGLDEMEEIARPLCITAINTYRTTHFTPLVVCSRSAEYQAASAQQRLFLQNAIVVQLLTLEQIEQVFRQGGESLAALHEALGDNQELRDLATTPLMLSILVLAYHGTSVADLQQQQAALEHQVWTDYVDRMVREKGAERQHKQDVPIKCYSLEQTRSWLGWLAQQMQTHNQTLFYGESLREEWLPISQQRAIKWLVNLLPAVILGAISSILLSFFVYSPSNLALLYQIGLIGGFIGGCVRTHQGESVLVNVQRSWRKQVFQVQGFRLLRAGILAILVVACFGLDLDPTGEFYKLSDWIQEGSVFGGSLLISVWVFQVIITRLALVSPYGQSAPRWVRLSDWLLTIHIQRALWTATLLGISYGLTGGLFYGSRYESNELLYIVSYGLSDGVGYGLIFGATIYLVNLLLDGQIETVRLAEKVSWTWRGLLHVRHLQMSLIIALACLFFRGLGIGLQAGLQDGLSVGLSTWLSWGLTYGLSVGLSYWLLVGMYQGIMQRHLEGQDHRHFNQGLHRSLSNGFFLSLLGAGIISGIGVLSIGLSEGLGYGLHLGLSEGLDYGLHLGQAFGWFFLFGGWFVLWVATGGLTVLRHYILRLLLARSHTFPLHVRHFLDDATARVLLRQVGGGYGFVHRRLLDYFADLEATEK